MYVNRFGIGATREVGLDVADWGAKYLFFEIKNKIKIISLLFTML